MISPEILRRYPFFAMFEGDSLREVAMITEEIEIQAGEALFEINERADHLYLLMSGNLHLHFTVENERDPSLRKDFLVGTINPGELASISALIEPHILTASAIAASSSRALKVKAAPFRELCQSDPTQGRDLYHEVARTAKDRLQATRVLLAAASGPDWSA